LNPTIAAKLLTNAERREALKNGTEFARCMKTTRPKVAFHR